MDDAAYLQKKANAERSRNLRSAEEVDLRLQLLETEKNASMNVKTHKAEDHDVSGLVSDLTPSPCLSYWFIFILVIRCVYSLFATGRSPSQQL